MNSFSLQNSFSSIILSLSSPDSKLPTYTFRGPPKIGTVFNLTTILQNKLCLFDHVLDRMIVNTRPYLARLLLFISWSYSQY